MGVIIDNSQAKKRVLLINGVNLNMLGKREPDTYGHQTLREIEEGLIQIGSAQGVMIDCFQSNREYEIVDKIQQSPAQYDGIIINPGAFTHTSIAIRDAFLSVEIPFYEIHISNIYSRESFRHQSYLSDIANGVIIGTGIQGYHLAFLGLSNVLYGEDTVQSSH